MVDLSVAGLVAEVLSSLATAEDLESWLQRRMDGSVENAILKETFRATTNRLLIAKPPQIAEWERLLVAAAAISGAHGQAGTDCCKAAISELAELIQNAEFEGASSDQIVAFATALTLVLTAQRKLRQPIEDAMDALCNSFANLLPEMAEQCQNIWQRRGQMSGSLGLYVWDTRNHEWRLSQDFKPYPPAT